jgi:hypothetical protein
MRHSADGPDWVANELVLSDARLQGSYPDTALVVCLESASTGEQLLRKGLFIWHNAGRAKTIDGVVRSTPRSTCARSHQTSSKR